MTKYMPYPKYKDSGVAWIGHVPEGWEVIRLKFTLSMQLQYGANEVAEFEDRSAPRYVRITDIRDDGTLRDETFKSLPEDIATPYMLKDNDILLARSGATVGKTFIYKSSWGRVAYAGYLIRARFVNNINVHFIYNFLNSISYWNWINSVLIQATLQNVSAEKYANLVIPFPPFSEQQAIADYLDKKCAQIDTLITKKTHSITLLKEKRQAMITQAVTKGLHPHVKMKASGVAWIGDVPEGWEVKKLRYIGICQNGINKDGSAFGSGLPFVNYSDVYKNYELPFFTKYLIESTTNERKIYSVLKGDIFFTRTSETLEEIALSSVCIKTYTNATFAGFLIRVRPYSKIINPNFSKYYFRNKRNREYFIKEMHSVTRASLSQELLKQLPVLLPPLLEQQAIADYLDKKCTHIDTLIRKTEQSIALLKEKRQALITAVVTGKINVKEAVC